MRKYYDGLAVQLENDWEPANETEPAVEGVGENFDLSKQSRIWWGSTSMEMQGKFWIGMMEKLNKWAESSQNNTWAKEDAENILRVQGVLSIHFEEDYRFYESADFEGNIELARAINKCRKILMLMFGAYSFAEDKEGKLIFQQKKSGFWNKRVSEFTKFGQNKPDKVDLKEENC